MEKKESIEFGGTEMKLRVDDVDDEKLDGGGDLERESVLKAMDKSMGDGIMPLSEERNMNRQERDAESMLMTPVVNTNKDTETTRSPVRRRSSIH